MRKFNHKIGEIIHVPDFKRIKRYTKKEGNETLYFIEENQEFNCHIPKEMLSYFGQNGKVVNYLYSEDGEISRVKIMFENRETWYYPSYILMVKENPIFMLKKDKI